MEHDTSDETGESCWCCPEVLQPCPECLRTHPDPDCWRCRGNGLVPEYDEAIPSVIVHNDADDIIREAGL